MALNSAGGLARAAKLSPEERSAIAKAAAKARWAGDRTRDLRRQARHHRQAIVRHQQALLRIVAEATAAAAEAAAAQQALDHTLDKLGVA